MSRLVVLIQALVLSGSLAALDLDAVKNAFNDKNGVMLRLQGLTSLTNQQPSSATVWRKDLPLAIYTTPRARGGDAVGVIFEPENAKVLCGYPINGLTKVRVDDKTKETDLCGVMDSTHDYFDPKHQSGRCNFATPKEYAETYFYKPLVRDLLGRLKWSLEYSTCSFASLPETLEAQKALLLALMHQPEDMTLKDAVGYAADQNMGLTSFNEIIAAPYDASAIGGIFWAHQGPFRAPSQHDKGACKIQAYLKSTTDALPVFELAYTNLERPFAGCTHGWWSTPTLDCLSRGLGEWQRNLTSDGGRDAGDVFRVVDASTFRALWCGWPEEKSPTDTSIVV